MERTDTDQTVTIARTPSGLTMVHRHCPGASEYCGVTANVGSRDEHSPEEFGLAHFVEHTIFKGTPRRSDSYVLNRMEQVGGELNAFTTKEETTVYAAMPAGNRRRATDLIAELVTESTFPAAKIDREREVIADEIDSYLDSPADAVFDLYDEMLFCGSSMAHNILGTKDSVLHINPAMCREFLVSHFTADNMVYFYLGPDSPEKVFRTASEAFAGVPSTWRRAPRTTPAICAPECRRQSTDAHQSHTVMGTQIGGLHSADRFATALAVNILGGPGMNSWLNVSLRERRGLVYTVDASTALYDDLGVVTIYFGCDHEDVARCTALCRRQLERLASAPLPPRILNACRRQFIGQATLGSDNKEQMALSTGRAILHGLEAPSPKRTASAINAVTAEALQRVATTIADTTLRTLTLC